MYMYNAIDSTNLEQKFDSPGEPWDPWAYTLKSIDRTQ